MSKRAQDLGVVVFFDHFMEMVQHRCGAVRTALGMPWKTLGGVTNHQMCDHRYEHFTARAGPNLGRLCCSACGGVVGRRQLPTWHYQQRAKCPHRGSAPLCTHLDRAPPEPRAQTA